MSGCRQELYGSKRVFLLKAVEKWLQRHGNNNKAKRDRAKRQKTTYNNSLDSKQRVFKPCLLLVDLHGNKDE